MRKLIALPALLFGLLTLPVTTAEAVTFGFDCITGNAATSCQILEDQISVDITDGGGGTVDFEFANSGPDASSIAQIYFDDTADAFFDWSTLGVTGSTGTIAFSICVPTGNLPGGNTVGFDATACAEADAPAPTNGVNPGESVTLTATLLAGQSFAELLDAIESGLFSTGVHVQAFENGASESGVIDGGDEDDVDVTEEEVVAEPTTLLLLGSGLVAVGARFRRRR